MTVNDLAATLSTIALKAKDLRDAGVTGRVSIGDIHFEIERTEAPAMPAAMPQQPGNPLDDPDTFGGHIPTRRGSRPTRPEDDEE